MDGQMDLFTFAIPIEYVPFLKTRIDALLDTFKQQYPNYDLNPSRESEQLEHEGE